MFMSKDQSPWSVSVAGHNRFVFYDTPAVLMAVTRQYRAVTIGVALATPAGDQFALPTKLCRAATVTGTAHTPFREALLKGSS